MDHRDGLRIDYLNRTSQNLMPRNHLIESMLDGIYFKFSSQAHSFRLVIDWHQRIRLLQKP